MGGCPTHIAAINKRRHHAKLERTARIASLYLAGHSQKAISELEQVSSSSVSECLQDARDIWRERAAEAISAHKARELAKIDQVELEAWEAWRRSQRDEVMRERGGTPKGSISKKRRRSQYGDGAMLGIIQKCIDQRIKLLGLEQPENAGGSLTSLIEVVVSTRDEAAKVLPYTQFEDALEPGE